MLHRDLKPSNVLLQPAGPADASSDGLRSFSYTVKLTDFGIAKVLDEEADGTMTLTGAVIGTAAYMAPEQAAGQKSKIAEVTDIYGLGAILYELLTGRAPFGGDFPADVLRKVIEGHPIAPRRLRADVPRDLEAVCLRCLETAPQHRYATAQQLGEELERFLQGRPVLARPVTPLVRALRRWQRRPRGVQLTLAISFAFLMLAAMGLWIFGTTRNRGPDATPTLSPSASEPRTQAQYESDVAEAYEIWRTSPLRFDDHRDIGDEMERLLVRDVPKAEEIDRRGFEWHYLWKLAHPERYAVPLPEVLEMKGHNDVVYFVTFSANGSRIATASKDHTARVWNAKTGRQVCLCQGHTNEVNWADFSPDGKLIATASDDCLVKLWEAESGKELATLKEHTAPVVGVGFCPTRGILASGDKKGMLILWDVATRKSIRSVKAHQLDIQSLNWSPDGKWLLTAGGVDRVKIWDPNNLIIHREYVFGAASAVFNGDASLIASGSIRPTGVMIDDVPTGRRRMVLNGHTDRVQSVRFSPDGLSVASCSNDGSVRTWDLTTRRGWNLKRTLPGRAYWCLAFSPDGTRLAVCGDKNVVEVGDTSVSTYWTYLKLEGLDAPPKDLSFVPQDLMTIWGENPTGNLRKWNLNHQPPKEEEHDDQQFSSVAYDRQLGVTALGMQREIRVLRSNRDGLDQRRFETPVGAADFLRIAKNGHDVFAVAGSSPEPQWSVKRWNVDARTETWSLEIPRKDFAAIAFSADDQLFALSRLDGRIELFDASSATKIKVLGTDRGPAHCLAFSPTQRRLASCTDQGVRVWDLETNQALANFTSAHESVDQIVYFPDGMRLATVCRANRTIRIWSMAEGSRELLTLPFPPHIAKHGSIGKMAISPDGRSIACFGTAIDGKWGVYLWQINPESEHLNLGAMPRGSAGACLRKCGGLPSTRRDRVRRNGSALRSAVAIECEDRS